MFVLKFAKKNKENTSELKKIFNKNNINILYLLLYLRNDISYELISPSKYQAMIILFRWWKVIGESEVFHIKLADIKLKLIFISMLLLPPGFSICICSC